MEGFKIMTYKEETKMIHSLADSRMTIPCKKGYQVNVPSGFYVGSSKEFVHQYYGGNDPESPEEMLDGEYEVRCTWKYNQKDVIRTGTAGTVDLGYEIVVSKAELLEVWNVTKKERML